MGKPTKDDADIMLQLMRWGAAQNLQDAMNWIWSDAFIDDYVQFAEKYPPGSAEYGKASKVCGWFESIGTLYKHGLISGELLFDWITVKLPWSRLESFALGVRKKAGEPRLYENFEAMAKE
tara:strand:- start:109 stop:471 length:363 start_codon:yes stop_codon:yes gene_type:complete